MYIPKEIRKQHASRGGKVGGKKQSELGLGFHQYKHNPSLHKQWASLGGKSHKNKKCIFYVLEFYNDNESFIKVGVTAVSIKKRYASVKNYKYKVILEIKPQVMVTYDEFGGYGHPDHIKAHQVAMRAAEIAKWQIQKIYWNIMPKSVVQRGMDAMKAQGSDFFGAENVDELPFVKDDSFVSAVIHAPNQVEKKMAAMKAHATQISLDGPFFALSNNLGVQVFGDEYYTLVRGEKSGPFNTDNLETDLFAGIAI